MDEPFAALDAQTREPLQDELLRIWRAHRQDDRVHHPRHRRGRLPGPAGGGAELPARADQAVIDIDLGDRRTPADATCARPARSATTATRSGRCCTTRCDAPRTPDTARSSPTAPRGQPDDHAPSTAPTPSALGTRPTPASPPRGRPRRHPPPANAAAGSALGVGQLVRRSAAVVLFLLLWEFGPQYLLDPARQGLPAAAVRGAAGLVGAARRAGSSQSTSRASLTRSVTGFGLAVLAGIPLGLLIGLVPAGCRAAQPAARAVPQHRRAGAAAGVHADPRHRRDLEDRDRRLRRASGRSCSTRSPGCATSTRC